jgi:hypothetical protein
MAPHLQGQTLEWVRQAATRAGAELGTGVSADGLGNIFFSVRTDGDLGGAHIGNWDVYLANYDAAGNRRWGRLFGTNDVDYPEGVSAGGLGNVYLAGDTLGNFGGTQFGSYDAFVTKYDAAGRQQWKRQMGTSGVDDITSLSADGLGNVYLAGWTNGSLSAANAGGLDAIIGKYDAAGSLQWTRQLGTDAYDAILALSADGLG